MSRPIPVWLVAVTATALAVAIWVLAVPVDGVALEAGQPPLTVGPASVVVVALVATLGGWAVRTWLKNRTPVAWWLTCGIVLLVSLLGPLGATTPAARGTLLTLHLVVGTVIAVGLDPRRVRVRAQVLAA